MSANRSLVFNQLAHLYDEVRPTYPEEVIDYLTHSLQLSDNLLEIGCGTGQLTLPLAQKGFQLTVVEQGKELLSIAKKKLQNFPEVTYLHCSFEDYEGGEETYDAILCAQAFHWIEPGWGLNRVAQLLKKGGLLFLIWNLDTRSSQTAFWQATEPLYQRYASSGQSPNRRLGLKAEEYTAYISQSPYFEACQEKIFPWSIIYSEEHYIKLISTYSDHYTMEEPAKSNFFKEMKGIIERFDGQVERLYETLVVRARKV